MRDTPMDAEGALTLLASSAFEERLRGARFFGLNMVPAALPKLKNALQNERVGYVRTALEIAIKRCELAHQGPIKSPDEGNADQGQADLRAVNAHAIEWVAGTLLHDLEPKIGKLQMAAEQEVPNFDGSQVKKQLEAIRRTFDGISDLRRAASSPRSEHFDLSMLINDILIEESEGKQANIFLQGQQPLLISSDPNLLTLAISNGLRNALEAVASKSDDERNIVIDWGETEIDRWVVILDDGAGLSGGAEAAFKIGATNKTGHSGFGLAIVRQAMENLNGCAKLEPSKSGGARLELRWGRW